MVALNIDLTTLADESVSLVISGCVPNASTTVSMSRGPWRSTATFEADDSGAIDLSTQSPTTGDYQGIDRMGLFWSMRAEGVTPPVLTAESDRYQLEVGDDILYFERLYAAPGVVREEVRGGGLTGVFYRPSVKGPHPAILALNGSDGGVNEPAAALLASHGYATLSLAYFNYGALQPDLHRIPLEYFETAIEWLKKHIDVDADRIAVRGVSRGGELALLLGSRFPDLRAVLALVPSSVAWGSISENEERMNQPSWTYRSQPIAFNRRVILEPEANPDSVDAVSYTPGFLQAMQDSARACDAEIEVERINGNSS